MRLHFAKIWFNQKFRLVLFQFALLIFIIFIGIILWQNLQNNLKLRGIAVGFEFWNETAGFSIIMHLIDYTEKSTYGRAFWVGLLNTLLVSGLGIFFATIIGVIVGLARLSSHWIIAKCALGYVELIRNIPLLLQIFFWYFVVLRAAPLPQNSFSFANSIFINKRGIYLPAPIGHLETALLGLGALLCLGVVLIFFMVEKRYCLAQGCKRSPRRFAGQIALILMGVFLLLSLSTFSWEFPVLQGLNFEHGIVLIPEFLALLIALSVYTAAFIAEIVRMGILSVHKGQNEAALALGLTKWQALRLILIPQALRTVLPPLTNQYLNLTKNSSLAAAIAYPDLVSVFAGTVLNQTGQAVEIIAITMGVYLVISLTISFFILLYEKRTQLGAKN